MKKKIVIKKYGVTGLLMISIVFTARAQVQLNTPAAYEKFKINSLWMKSSNAAGSMLDNPITYTDLNVSYRLLNGDFHLPQRGDDDNRLNFHVEGSAILTGLYAWGEFSHSRDRVKGTRYNASIADPLRGMPYYLADTTRSEWYNQSYDMTFRVATKKLLNCLYLGIEGTYNAGSYAKQMNLRTVNRTLFFELRPAIAVTVAPGHNIGANFEYYAIKEEGNTTKVAVAGTIYAIYEQLGLGMGVEKNSTDTRTTNFTGSSMGGALQYNYQSRTFDMMLSGYYAYKAEQSIYTFTAPRNNGAVRDYRYGAVAQFIRKCRQSDMYINLRYDKKDIDGIQFIYDEEKDGNSVEYIEMYSSVRSTYGTESCSLDYSFLRHRDDSEYTWRIDAGAKYLKQDDAYIMPESLFNYENLSFSIGGKKNFIVGDRLTNRLLVGIGGLYGHNLSGEYIFGGPDPGTFMVTELYPLNLSYLTNDYYGFNLSVVYSQRVRTDWRANLYAKADFQYISPKGSNYDKRQLLHLTIGCNF